MGTTKKTGSIAVKNKKTHTQNTQALWAAHELYVYYSIIYLQK